MRRLWFGLAALLYLVGCGDPVPRGDAARIMAMGDSLMAWHAASDRSIADVLADRLGEPVIDRSVVGASFTYPLPISGSMGLRIERQFVQGDWDWVVLNGGGNDLWLGCGCGKCDRQLERLVTADGAAGQIPDLVGRIRATGARVIYIGYLRTPGVTSPVEGCAPVGDAMEARIAAMAARDDGVVFLSNADLVPVGDRSFHDVDRIHPSPKGSAAIAARVAELIE